MLANAESTFDDACAQFQELEGQYSIAQPHTQCKDIRIRSQRVSRLIQVRRESFGLCTYNFFVCSS